jgi:hypothetical protein
MRLKKNEKYKTVRMELRCKPSEKNRVQQKANIYTEGNLSEYILFASLNFVPSKEDFEKDKKEG